MCDTDDSAGDGPCTLRAAIEQANFGAGTDTIAFNIAGTGPHTIAPASALPTITDPVIIDGTSEPDFVSTPIVELDGTGAGALVDGLNITAGSSTVKGLVINRFAGDGIELVTSGGNAIEGNYIGTDTTGTAVEGNGRDGVNINGAPSNTIGGTTSGARNVISGNRYGVLIDGSGATGNTVEGNHIGTDVTGSAALGNVHGVFISSASSNTIGGTTPGARNVISGSVGVGVVLEGAGNKVEGNYIGTNAAGNAALGNNSSGVHILGASSNTIGGTASGARNVISGNDVGVHMELGATGNKVEGNYIGTNAAGSAALGNSDGVIIDSPSNTIGGTASGARNVISGNDGDGIIIGSAGIANKVEGNYIGTDVTGSAALGNKGWGVYILFASSNTIGGSASGARNVISSNEIGVVIDVGAAGNKVEGNYIGTDATGSAALGNSEIGVVIQNASSNTVGGPGAGNVISGNGNAGVYILSGTGNTITENSIHSNGDLGIDNDIGGNTELTPPTVTAAGSASGSSDCASCTIEVFSDADDEGETFHGSTPTAAGPCPCAWSFSGAVTGPNVTATVTDASGNTSEFSAPFSYDTDLDGFTDAIEAFVGTDPTDSCADTAAANDEADDKWPADTNDDQFVNVFDLAPFIPALNSVAPGPPYTVRLDLNANGAINVFDVVPFIQLLNKACLP